MSWLERISALPERGNEPPSNEEQMSPGLTGQYDWELREKAGQHMPPPPPEAMGVEGEYDPSGLAKRVAAALDGDPIVEDLETVEIVQIGKAIVFKGRVPEPGILERLVEIASQVDGTAEVDTHEVIVEGDENVRTPRDR
ncbi:MAG: BON domain-containing protein [Cyanosarcina radialis HA8281-LM2]|nr:BON domain-containing protein [Cyanosarcina radialis HA8281-LM2]